MPGLKSKLLAPLGHAFPRVASFSGPEGKVWVAGALDRAPTIARYFCGDGAKLDRQRRCPRSRIGCQAIELAAVGTVSILFSGKAGPKFPDPAGRSIVVPLRIALRKSLPDTFAALMGEIKNSRTQEDLRRIRKAGFTFRLTKDPEQVREFHARYHAPLVAWRFPEDGSTRTVTDMLSDLGSGGEILCADLNGDWVAGIFNKASAENYSMGALGIRDADHEIRQKRAVSALLVGSMERAVALGCPTATLGYSVPFLGKGPIWFKAKWGCTLEVSSSSPNMQMFLNLRHEHVRKVLAESPIIHRDGTELAVSTWLLPGQDALDILIRETSRFKGIARWYVLADRETMGAAEKALNRTDKIVPVSVDLDGTKPLWLGELLRRPS